MTEDEFWALVEGARRESEGALGRQVQLLRDYLLEQSSIEVLLAFRNRWEEADNRVFTWPVWDAATVLLGPVSDDFFTDVRAWIISHGRETVHRIESDPDALVDLADDVKALDTGDAEVLGLLFEEMWEELAGDDEDEPPESQVPSHGPTDTRIDLHDADAVRQHFPRLAELKGWPRAAW